MPLLLFWYQFEPVLQFPKKGRTGNFWLNCTIETGMGDPLYQ